MLKVDIKISGSKEAIVKLKQFEKTFTNWKIELRQIGNFLKKFYSGPVFETEGGIVGRRWKPLSPGYEAWKRKNFAGRGILQRSGEMRKSFVVNVKRDSMELVNKAFYAKYHQQGRGVPERVLISLDQPRKDDIIRIFKKGLKKKIALALR